MVDESQVNGQDIIQKSHVGSITVKFAQVQLNYKSWIQKPSEEFKIVAKCYNLVV